jgi:tetratricopeptide (TPR) repeat protein
MMDMIAVVTRSMRKKIWFLWMAILFTLSSPAQTAPPMSSLYQHLKNDAIPGMQFLYRLLDNYYNNTINAKQLSRELERFGSKLPAREMAIKNMALSYTRTGDDDFGFYNLRLAVNDADALPESDVVKGVVYAEFANYLFARETHDLAIDFFRKSIPILEKNKPAGLEGAGFSLLNKMLRSFTQLGENDSVAVYMDKVISHAAQYQDKLWLSSAYNNKGYRFYEQGRYDSALACYRQAQQYLDTTIVQHLLFYENVNENIAHIHAQQGAYEQAAQLQRKVIETRLQHEGNLPPAIKGMIYYTNYCAALHTPQAAIALFRQSGFPVLTQNPDYLNLRMKLAQLAGNRQEYLDYFNQLLAREKQKLEADKQLLVSRKGINKYVKSRNEMFEQQLRLEKLQKAKLGQSVLYRNIFIVALALVSGLIGYGIHRQGRFKKQLLEAENEALSQRERILDLKNDNLKNSLELKEKDMAKVVADNKLRTELKKEFLKKLQTLNETDEKKLRSDIRKLRTDLSQTIDHHGKIDLLQHNIDEINIEYEQKLRQNIPAITHSEMEICSLIRLGYNNTEIAGITNKTPENVRVNKFRIKQKAGLSDMKELEQLLVNI